ncbi:DUF962 domain-containing protein [Bdellovibrio sp. HCB337]|uniref:Mpo1 family 2-hydroxy fatty acid dioxygenase n=1 Tax=Bdellovibrio sp. HCB337 TaxID=3394358 RepID=UPI0039A6DAA5
MKTLDQWLQLYSVSHQNRTNQLIHKVCVPAIFFSLFGMIWGIQFGEVRLAWIIAILGMAFYIRLGVKSSLLMLFQLALTFVILHNWSQRTESLFLPNLGIFVVAWIGQFIGHKIEGAKPSFFEDLQFLLVGPLWVFRVLLKK